MEGLHYFDTSHLNKILLLRDGESRLGQYFHLLPPTLPLKDALLASSAKFVIFGIPEDIGVRANHGNPGARSSWEVVRNTLCNFPFSENSNAKDIAVLGHLNTTPYYNDISSETDVNQLRQLTSRLDQAVAALVAVIISAGKIPIAVGGGHNNAFGLIKGMSQALGKSVNVANLDAHTDLRTTEGRHSGNPFRYAFDALVLDKYAVMGVQEAYTSQPIWDYIKRHLNHILCQTYDQISLRLDHTFEQALQNTLNFVKEKPFGVELDVDVMAHFPSSAQSSSGFTVGQARRYITVLGQHENAQYLHLCEGIISGEDGPYYAKALALMILDFCKARKPY